LLAELCRAVRLGLYQCHHLQAALRWRTRILFDRLHGRGELRLSNLSKRGGELSQQHRRLQSRLSLGRAPLNPDSPIQAPPNSTTFNIARETRF
jgi:hypothetical protein